MECCSDDVSISLVPSEKSNGLNAAGLHGDEAAGGEEDRLGHQSILNIQTVTNYSTKSTNGYHSNSSSPAPKLLIKTTETRNNSRYSTH
ncbi:hypothetical protein KUCAC02_013407 [Chaenocephalus aceratus]|nr:hypothetical protein KUCAC02_013407 [Chaenocephalus aceratus]